MNHEFVVDTNRTLPHKQLTDSVLFITWRLAFDLPPELKIQLSQQRMMIHKELDSLQESDRLERERTLYREKFEAFDLEITKLPHSTHILYYEPYLQILKNTIKHDEGIKYELYA